jgi:hypothetical protein
MVDMSSILNYGSTTTSVVIQPNDNVKQNIASSLVNADSGFGILDQDDNSW